MTSVCVGNGPSQPNPTYQNIVNFSAIALAEFLSKKGMGWAYGIAPAIGTLTFNLPTFCAAEPPTLPIISAADIANYFSPFSTTGAYGLRIAMTQLVQHFLWYDLCQCTSGAQPAYPPPLAEPSGQQQNPPALTAPTAGGQCATNNHPSFPCLSNPFTQTVFGPGTTAMQPGGTAFDLSLVSAGSTQITHVSTAALDANGATIQTWPEGDIPIGGTGYTTTHQLPSGTAQITITFSGAGAADGHHMTWTADEICSGLGSSGALPCCPPDTSHGQLLQQILSLLYMVQTQIAPFNYVEGFQHTFLSQGSDTIRSPLLGLHTSLVNIPAGHGEVAGNPTEYFGVGWLCFCQSTICGERYYIQHQEQFIFPPAAGIYTSIHYSLKPGQLLSATELLRVTNGQ
jgi:hypothetical protein